MNIGTNWLQPSEGCPEFTPGKKWVSTSGHCVSIVSVCKYPGSDSDHMSNYGITYQSPERGGVQHDKDAWSFQVRYSPVKDANQG